MGRLLIVSNRLPVTVSAEGDAVRASRAPPAVSRRRCAGRTSAAALWIGWPGDVARAPTSSAAGVDRRLPRCAAVPVHLTPHRGGALLRRLLQRRALAAVPLPAREGARSTRAATGTSTARSTSASPTPWSPSYQPGDAIWVHDYQLMLVPADAPRALPDARIGFFLHIPFPASEVFRTAARGARRSSAGCSAPISSASTPRRIAHNFALAACARARRRAATSTRSRYDGRARPPRRASRSASTPSEFASSREARRCVAEAASDPRARAGGRTIVLGVDRLDYTKGIPRRLARVRAAARATTRAARAACASCSSRCPTRERVEAYARAARARSTSWSVASTAQFGTLDRGADPLLYRSLAARAARRALPRRRRDAGHAAARRDEPRRQGVRRRRTDDDGVLVLSEFAGAAAELDEALMVNPYDIDGVADALERALTMAARRAAARECARCDARVRSTTCTPGPIVPHALEARAGRPARDSKLARREELALAGEQRSPRRSRELFLDYDGTLAGSPPPSSPRPTATCARCWPARAHPHRPCTLSAAGARATREWFSAIADHAPRRARLLVAATAVAVDWPPRDCARRGRPRSASPHRVRRAHAGRAHRGEDHVARVALPDRGRGARRASANELAAARSRRGQQHPDRRCSPATRWSRCGRTG